MDKDYLIIESGADLFRVVIDDIMYFESDHNYSHVHLTNSKSDLVSLQLGKISELIDGQLKKNGRTFVRIGNRLIVNTQYIYKIDVAKQELILMAGYKGKSSDYSIYKVEVALKPNHEFTMKDECITCKLKASKDALRDLKNKIKDGKI